MLSDQRSLLGFLAEEHQDAHRDVRADLALFEPYFRKAESGMFDLAFAGRLRPEDTTVALAAATGVDIDRVAFVSLADGAAPLRGAARESFWEAHAKDLSADVKGMLWRRNTGPLEAGLGAERQARLETILWHAIGEPLWHSFERNRWDETGQALRLVLRANVLEAIRQFSGFILLGDEQRLNTLRPLMALMADALPIGERRGQEGTWVCITA